MLGCRHELLIVGRRSAVVSSCLWICVYGTLPKLTKEFRHESVENQEEAEVEETVGVVVNSGWRSEEKEG